MPTLSKLLLLFDYDTNFLYLNLFLGESGLLAYSCAYSYLLLLLYPLLYYTGLLVLLPIARWASLSCCASFLFGALLFLIRSRLLLALPKLSISLLFRWYAYSKLRSAWTWYWSSAGLLELFWMAWLNCILSPAFIFLCKYSMRFLSPRRWFWCEKPRSCC